MDKEKIQEQKGHYKNHLEFLGYDVKEMPEDEQEIVGQRGTEKLYCNVREAGIWLTRIFDISKSFQRDKHAVFEFLNAANSKLISKVAVNDIGALFITLWLGTPYEKSTFGNYLDVFRMDVEKMWEVPNAENIFKQL